MLQIFLLFLTGLFILEVIKMIQKKLDDESKLEKVQKKIAKLEARNKVDKTIEPKKDD